MSDQLPSRARAVVVGGGIIGTSVAYHLAQLGCPDVVLIERDRLTSGTTWHAAGLMVTFGSTSATSTELRRYTRDLYARLEDETGLSTGLKQVGFIELAADADRLQEYRRVAAFNRYCGVDVHEISPGEIKELFPLARTDDVRAGFYVPDDGRANPVDVTMSLARGARQQGVQIIEGVRVTGFNIESGRFGPTVTGVRTDRGGEPGFTEAEFVVNCAGMWARQLGELAGVSIPLQAAEHYYLITEPMAGVHGELPVLEDPASFGYYREEGGGLLFGLFEPVSAPWRVDGVPDDFSFGTLPPDWDRMAPHLEGCMARIPAAHDAGVRTFFCGPESFTPDLQPIVGEAPELRNYFVCAGLNSIGILTGGGLGLAVAHWILNGQPDIDVTGINIDRLHPYQANPAYRADRGTESLGSVYRAHYPGMSMTTARGARLSPLHDRLLAKGAHFRDVSGWESPDWYVPDGEIVAPTLGWERQPWFRLWEAEHHAARNNVILMDMSFMSKFLVQGRDAGRLLERLSANRVASQSGRVTYTQWLNEDGRIEADLTVTKLDDSTFWVVATDTAHRHVLTRMKRCFADAHAFVADVTGGYAQLNIQGTRSRELLSAVTSYDMADFPYRAAKEIDIGYARVLCLRLTYLGELGYELYIPAEQARQVYDRLIEAGAAFGLRHAGLKALSSLRMEKGYRDYGHDIDNTDTVLEAGLGFAVDLDKPGGFIGRDAVAEQRAAGPLPQRLCQVLVTDPEPMMYHAEVVLRNGSPAGYIRSASYGFTLGGAVGLAMISAERGTAIDQSYLDGQEWTVEIAGSRHPAQLSLRPFYDPGNTRIRD